MAERTDLEQLVYQISADVSKLQKQSDQARGIIRSSAKKTADEVEQAGKGMWSKFFGHPAEVSKALDNVFSRTRLGVIEEGGAKIPLFGSALEALGPAGLVAAAGVGAAAIAFEGARKAMEWTEELEKTAAVVGVTTTELQEYHHVAQQFGIDNAAMDDALKGLNENLGKMQSGVRAQRTIPFFEELKIPRSDLANIQDGAQLIPIIAEHMKNLDSEAKKVQLAKALGGEAILPVLEATATRINNLRNEAHALGLVISEDLIKKGADANKKFTEASDVIKTQMMVAFVELAPVIAGVAGWLERAALAAGKFATALASPNSAAGLKAQIDALKQHQREIDQGGPQGFMAAQHEGHPFNPGAAKASLQQQIDARQNAVDALGWYAALTNPGEAPKPKVKLGDLKSPKGAKPSDQTDGFDKSAADAAYTAQRDLAKAQAELTDNIEARAKAEDSAEVAENAKRLEDLSAKEVEIRKSKLDAHNAAQLATLGQAEADEQAASDARREKIARDAKLALTARDLQTQEAISAQLQDALHLEAGAALTRKAAYSKEAEALRARQRDDQAKLDAEQAAKAAKDPSDNGVDAAQEQLALHRKQEAERKALEAQFASPWDAWAHEGVKAAADVEKSLQTAVTGGLDRLNSGLAEAIASGKSMGDVFKSVFRQMESDAISYLLKQAEIGVFGGGGSGPGLLAAALHFIPGFAGGTNSAPGGMALVGEHGPELVNLPGGSKVIPNHMIRSAGAMPTLARGQTTITHNLNLTVDVSGANGDEGVRRIAGQAAAVAAQRAYEASHRATSGWTAQDQLERG